MSTDPVLQDTNLINQTQIGIINFKKGWYNQSWILCVLFALWPLIVPAILGVILLVFCILDDIKVKNNTISLQKLAVRYGAMDAQQRHQEIETLQKTLNGLEQRAQNVSSEIASKQSQLEEIKQNLVITEEELLVQSFGLYSPKYTFTNALEYKARLEIIRAKQKDLVKSGQAATGNMNWTVNGNQSKGRKMVMDTQKLLLRAFNSECDEIVSRVKYNNFEQSLKRITSSHEAISKLGAIMNIEITRNYYNLKIEELSLALEYEQMRQQEKEDQKALREQMREEAKLQREIEAERHKLEKEQSHYESALAKIKLQMESADEAQKALLSAKQREIEEKLAEVEQAFTDIDYRVANQKAGYVYVISNIGAFGENVFKIGMTRRLTPEERIDELSDASVPFDFDIHAMIFTEDAPALETALHKAFEERKLNMVNTRREFFKVSLDEIKQVVRDNFDKTVEFIDIPDAEQYRISLKIKEAQKAG